MLAGVCDKASIIGMARLARRVVTGEDQSPLLAELSGRYAADPRDANALFDMAMLLRLTGKVEQSNLLQGEALGMQPCYRCGHGAQDGLQVLVFVTGADVMSNAPIDFLCEDTDLILHFLHMDAAASVDVPLHDIAFVAIGQSDANRPALEHLATLLPAWPKPVINAQCEQVLTLTRDGTSALFADAPEVLAPANLRVARTLVEALGHGVLELDALRGDLAYPMLIRPLETHGGKGLERIDAPAGWADYLARYAEAEFFLAPFVDYSLADGLFRKLRITFIEGRAFPTHMAISQDWLVHYISAGMLESAEKRAEEAAWMESFDQDFAVRHAGALQTVAARVGVDYFSIDCAETADGRFLLFEADVASIVHALDPQAVFPYKRVAMDKLFRAFQQALARRATAATAIQDAA